MFNVAIDGPAAAGKSTIAKMVAKIKGYTYIDVGACGTYGPDFFLLSYTVRLTGKLAKGSSYMQANSVYGSTKLAGEIGVSKFCKKAMIIRTAWLYSTFGNNFVKTMIRLGQEKPELGVIFDQIGTPTYARDLARVIMTAIEQGIHPGVYHFSNEGVISWYDFTKAIHRLAGITTCHVRPLHTKEYPTPAHRPHYSVLDKTKVKQTYGIEVPYWEESLKDCIEKL